MNPESNPALKTGIEIRHRKQGGAAPWTRSALTQVTEEEKAEREKLFILPETEQKPEEVRKTLKWTKASYAVGGIVFALMAALWIIPYLR